MATVTASVAPGPEPSRAPNYRIAEKLRQAAALLAEQGANPFRISAYRRAADAILRESRDLRDTFETKGMDGLLAVPHVGRGIGAAIVEMLRTGHWSQLERLRGTLDPVHVFQTVPSGRVPLLSGVTFPAPAPSKKASAKVSSASSGVETVASSNSP